VVLLLVPLLGGCPGSREAAPSLDSESLAVRNPGKGEGDEVEGGLEEPEPLPPVEVVERPRRLGVRGGLMVPGDAEEESWEPTAVFGLYFRPARTLSARVAYEMGFDYASVKRNDGFVTSHLYVLKGGLVFGRSNNGESPSLSPAAAVFFLTSVGAAIGDSSWEATDDDDSSSAGMLEVGLGIGPPRGPWVYVTIVNMGTEAMNTDDTFNVALYYDSASPPSVGDGAEDDTVLVDFGLGVGEETVVTFEGVESQVRSAWQTWATVDIADQIDESDETNNVGGPILIPWEPIPDLVVLSVEPSTTSPAVLELIDVDVRVRNTGQCTVMGFKLGLYDNLGAPPPREISPAGH
jgi:hypothetical protein